MSRAATRDTAGSNTAASRADAACSCGASGTPGNAGADEVERIRLTRLTERGG